MAVVIKAGDLFTKVSIVERVEGPQSDSGAPAITPQMRWQPWAAVRSLSGKKAERARQIVALATHEVEIRYRKGVNTRMFVEWEGRVLNIEHVDNVDNEGVKLLLTCVEET